jgi:hypothetical protein
VADLGHSPLQRCAHRVAAGRKKSPRHEVRWLNLSGFCLRPGFGVRVMMGASIRPAHNRVERTLFVDDLQCQVGVLVLLRRIAGGINASEQQILYKKFTSHPDNKKKRLNRQLGYERVAFAREP